MADDAKPILVLGYGNPLRRDDGLGARVVEVIAREEWPGVRTHTAQQLTPELAAEIAATCVVIFVDASVRRGVETSRRQATELEAASTHVCDPRGLLGLAGTVYDAAPDSWLVSVGGEDFTLGEDLSRIGRANCDEAVEAVRRIVWSVRETEKRAPMIQSGGAGSACPKYP